MRARGSRWCGASRCGPRIRKAERERHQSELKCEEQLAVLDNSGSARCTALALHNCYGSQQRRLKRRKLKEQEKAIEAAEGQLDALRKDKATLEQENSRLRREAQASARADGRPSARAGERAAPRGGAGARCPARPATPLRSFALPARTTQAKTETDLPIIQPTSCHREP